MSDDKNNHMRKVYTEKELKLWIRRERAAGTNSDNITEMLAEHLHWDEKDVINKFPELRVDNDSSHKVWLVASISVVLLVVAFIFLVPSIQDNFAGKAIGQRAEDAPLEGSLCDYDSEDAVTVLDGVYVYSYQFPTERGKYGSDVPNLHSCCANEDMCARGSGLCEGQGVHDAGVSLCSGGNWYSCGNGPEDTGIHVINNVEYICNNDQWTECTDELCDPYKISSCDFSDWEAGKGYVLTNDVSTNDDSCFFINVNEVTLDCRGYEIDGGGFPGSGIHLSGATDSTIKDCAVSRFSNGIIDSRGVGTLLISNTIDLNEVAGISFDEVFDTKLIDNKITENKVQFNEEDGYGVSLRNSDTTLFTRNIINDNQMYGVKFFGDVRDTVFTNNKACGNFRALHCQQSSGTSGTLNQFGLLNECPGGWQASYNDFQVCCEENQCVSPGGECVGPGIHRTGEEVETQFICSNNNINSIIEVESTPIGTRYMHDGITYVSDGFFWDQNNYPDISLLDIERIGRDIHVAPVSRDIDGNNVKVIYNWKDGSGFFSKLNLPFEVASKQGLWDFSLREFPVRANGAVWRRSGSFDGWGAYEFYGNEYIVVDDNIDPLNFEKDSSFTLEAWVKSAAGNEVNAVLSKRDGFGLGVMLNIKDGKCDFFTSHAGNRKINLRSTTFVNDGDWHHCVAVYDRGIKKIFVDGVLENTIDVSSDDYGDFNPGNEDLYIGAARKGESIHHGFKGMIDGVRVYERALSTEQILTLRAVPTGQTIVQEEIAPNDEWFVTATPTDGMSIGPSRTTSLFLPLELILDYDFNTIIDDVVRDESDNGNDGLIEDYFSSGGEVTLKGTDSSKIMVEEVSNFPNKALTLSMWVKGSPVGSDIGEGTIFSYAADFPPVSGELIDKLSIDLRRSEEHNSVTVVVSGTRGANEISLEQSFHSNLISGSGWHHLAILWTGNSFELYVNGDRIGESVRSGQQFGFITKGTITIGQKQSSRGVIVPEDSFAGVIDDIRIYNKLKFSEEIQEIIDESGKDDLELMYDFEKINIGVNVIDRSKNLYHGNQNFLLGVDEAEFRGETESYVITRDPLNNFPREQITVAFWMDGTEPGTLLSYAAPSREFLGDDVAAREFVIATEQDGLKIIIMKRLGEGDSFTFQDPQGILSTEGWKHVVVTWMSVTGEMIVYVNGEELGRGVLRRDVLLESGGTLVLGQEQALEREIFVDGASYTGQLDDLRVYSTARGREDIVNWILEDDKRVQLRTGDLCDEEGARINLNGVQHECVLIGETLYWIRLFGEVCERTSECMENVICENEQCIGGEGYVCSNEDECRERFSCVDGICSADPAPCALIGQTGCNADSENGNLQCRDEVCFPRECNNVLAEIDALDENGIACPDNPACPIDPLDPNANICLDGLCLPNTFVSRLVNSCNGIPGFCQFKQFVQAGLCVDGEGSCDGSDNLCEGNLQCIDENAAFDPSIELCALSCNIDDECGVGRTCENNICVGPIHHYDFNDGTAIDVIGNLDGEITRASTSTGPDGSGAFRYWNPNDNPQPRIVLPGSSDLTLNSGSISVWAKYTGGSGLGPANGNRYIFGRYPGGNAGAVPGAITLYYNGYNNGNDKMRFIIRGSSGGWKSVYSLDAFNDFSQDNNGWHHYTVTWSAEKVELYIDGIKQGEDVGTTLPVHAEGLDLTIGRRTDADQKIGWVGPLDDFRIYNYVLNEGEIFNIMDTDGDNVIDSIDNCANDVNELQEDGDGDGIGDVCDLNDLDGDGINNEFDNCEFFSNPGQEDVDGDGIGDVCDELDYCSVTGFIPHPVGSFEDGTSPCARRGREAGASSFSLIDEETCEEVYKGVAITKEINGPYHYSVMAGLDQFTSRRDWQTQCANYLLEIVDDEGIEGWSNLEEGNSRDIVPRTIEEVLANDWAPESLEEAHRCINSDPDEFQLYDRNCDLDIRPLVSCTHIGQIGCEQDGATAGGQALSCIRLEEGDICVKPECEGLIDDANNHLSGACNDDGTCPAEQTCIDGLLFTGSNQCANTDFFNDFRDGCVGTVTNCIVEECQEGEGSCNLVPFADEVAEDPNLNDNSACAEGLVCGVAPGGEFADEVLTCAQPCVEHADCDGGACENGFCSGGEEIIIRGDDTDGDGILNDVDQCLLTPPGKNVYSIDYIDHAGCQLGDANHNGCIDLPDWGMFANHISRFFEDGNYATYADLSGVNGLDLADLSIFATVVSNDFSDCLDDDNDGVMNEYDNCPASLPGDVVLNTGCP